MRKGITNDIFNQLEQLTIKYEKLSLDFKSIKKDTEKKYKKQINDLKLENQNLKYELKYLKDSIQAKINIAVEEAIKPYKERIKFLEEENIALKKENTILKKEVDRLKNQISKNSSNSNKPSSTDIAPIKKQANEYNDRVKGINAIGGKIGHKGYNLSKEQIEILKDNDNVEYNVVEHKINNVITDSYISKFVVDLKTITVITEHRFYYDKSSDLSLPSAFYTDVTYGNNIKTLCTLLNIRNVLSLKRLKEFISVITNNIINISTGTIRNFMKELNNKAINVVDIIKTKILNSKVMYTDETGSKVDGKKLYFKNYSTLEHVLYTANYTKGKKAIELDDILPRYLGDLIHDHNTVNYNYGLGHGECNVHGNRYLKMLFENTFNYAFKDMEIFLNQLNISKHIAIKYGAKCFNKTQLKYYSKRYDEFLENINKEITNISSTYYKDEASKVYRKHKKYKANYLLFIYNFDIAYDNNLSERDIRMVKTKTKISGGFRSIDGAREFANIMSIIKTCIKQNLDCYKTIKNIYEEKPVVI